MAEMGIQDGGSLFLPELSVESPPAEWIEEFWALLAESNVRVLFWSCPLNHPDPKPLRVTVEWAGDVAHCTQCPMTSELHRAHVAWCYETEGGECRPLDRVS